MHVFERQSLNSSKTIDKYLATYAEPDIQALNESLTIALDANANQHAFSAVLVIPIFDEPIENIRHFLSFQLHQSTVFIWVFNCPAHASADEQQRTQDVMKYFIEDLKATCVVPDSNFYCAQVSKNKRVLILDYCSQGKNLPSKQGVGLARKLGMDLALMLVQRQYQQHGKWVSFIHSSDADVTLPANYFNSPVLSKNCSAIVYPFQHIAYEGYEQAIALYDISLRYYVDQLKRAGSPYAFHTIGSLIAVAPLAYAQVRGMPKRSGAEDFYLLNKLAKVGEVVSLAEPTLRILARPSHRVPFGTGPALNKISEMAEPLSEYTYYQPKIFDALKCLLDFVSESEQTIASVDMFYSQLHARIPNYLAEQIIQTLRMLKFDKQFIHLSGKSDSGQFAQAFHTWFDAFITLRFIHIMRDNFYPNISLIALKNKEVTLESYPEFSALGI